MPLDVRYLQYCQPDNPFYAPPTTPKHARNLDVSSLAIPGWESKEIQIGFPASGHLLGRAGRFMSPQHRATPNPY